MFAKLFESSTYGQILVMLAFDDETSRPQLRYYAQTNDGTVSYLSITFSGDKAYGDAVETLRTTGIRQAELSAKALLSAAGLEADARRHSRASEAPSSDQCQGYSYCMSPAGCMCRQSAN